MKGLALRWPALTAVLLVAVRQCPAELPCTLPLVPNPCPCPCAEPIIILAGSIEWCYDCNSDCDGFWGDDESYCLFRSIKKIKCSEEENPQYCSGDTWDWEDEQHEGECCEYPTTLPGVDCTDWEWQCYE